MHITPRLDLVRPLLKPAFSLMVALVALALAVLPSPSPSHRCHAHRVPPPLSARTHYLLSVPRDAWQHPLRLVCPGRHDDGHPCDVSSAGPDGRFGTGDDINSWEL